MILLKQEMAIIKNIIEAQIYSFSDELDNRNILREKMQNEHKILQNNRKVAETLIAMQRIDLDN
jgi:hypothetical protein